MHARGKKGALSLKFYGLKNLPLSCRAEPHVVRVSLRLEAMFPTDASTAPTVDIKPRWTRPHFSFYLRLSLFRLHLIKPPADFFLVAHASPFPSSAASPTLDYYEAWTVGFVVGGQAGVRKSFSVAAHMHATASDRCTTSCRRSYYGNASRKSLPSALTITLRERGVTGWTGLIH